MAAISDESILITANIYYLDSEDLIGVGKVPNTGLFQVSNKAFPGHTPVLKAVQPFSLTASDNGAQTGAGSITIHNNNGLYDFFIIARNSTGGPRYVFNKQAITLYRWKGSSANGTLAVTHAFKAIVSEINYVGDGDIVIVFTDYTKELDTPLYVINKMGWSDTSHVWAQVFNPTDRYKPYNYNQFYKDMCMTIIGDPEFYYTGQNPNNPAPLVRWFDTMKYAPNPTITLKTYFETTYPNMSNRIKAMQMQLFNHCMPREWTGAYPPTTAEKATLDASNGFIEISQIRVSEGTSVDTDGHTGTHNNLVQTSTPIPGIASPPSNRKEVWTHTLHLTKPNPADEANPLPITRTSTYIRVFANKKISLTDGKSIYSSDPLAIDETYFIDYVENTQLVLGSLPKVPKPTISYMPGDMVNWSNRRLGIPNPDFQMYTERHNAMPFMVGDVFNIKLINLGFSMHPDLKVASGVDLAKCYMASPCHVASTSIYNAGTGTAGTVTYHNLRMGGIPLQKGADATWLADGAVFEAGKDWRNIPGGYSWVVQIRDGSQGVITADVTYSNVGRSSDDNYGLSYPLSTEPLTNMHGYTTPCSVVSVIADLVNRKLHGIEMYGALDRSIVFKGLVDDRLTTDVPTAAVDTSMFKIGYSGLTSDNLLNVCNQIASSANLILYSPIFQVEGWNFQSTDTPELCLAYNQVPPSYVGDTQTLRDATNNYLNVRKYKFSHVSYHNIVKDSYKIKSTKMPKTASVFIGACKNWSTDVQLFGMSEEGGDWTRALKQEYLEVYLVNQSDQISVYKFSPVTNKSIEGTLLITESDARTLAGIKLKLALTRTFVMQMEIPNLTDNTDTAEERSTAISNIRHLGKLVRIQHHRFSDSAIYNEYWGVVVGISKDIIKDTTQLEVLI